MADLEFNEPQEFSRYKIAPPPSFLTNFVLKTGIVETERAAQRVLLGVAIVCVALTLWFVISPSDTASTSSSGLPGPDLKAIYEAERNSALY